MGSELQANKRVDDHRCVAFFHGKVRKLIYVVHQKRLLKSLYGTRDASQVFATYGEEGLNDHWFSEKCGGAVFILGRNAGSIGVHWRDGFISCIPDDKADDLEQ